MPGSGGLLAHLHHARFKFALQDDTFVKMKPTAANLIFAALLGGGLMANRMFLKDVLGSAIDMPEAAWRSVLAVNLEAPWQLSDALLEHQGLNPGGAEAVIGYTVPNILIDHAMRNPPVPPGFWRGVNVNQNAIYLECFMDELAHAAGQDPLEFRRKLMGKHPHVVPTVRARLTKSLSSPAGRQPRRRGSGPRARTPGAGRGGPRRPPPGSTRDGRS